MPFIDGKDMRMVESPSLTDVNSFPSNRWGIPEPPSIEDRTEGIYSLTLYLASSAARKHPT